MFASGKIMSVAKDFKTNETLLTVSLPTEVAMQLLQLDGRYLDVKIEPHKDKRSASANKYFHVLVGKLAKTLNVSKEFAKNMLITRYGQPLTDNEGNILTYETAAPPDVIAESAEIHGIAIGHNGSNTIYKLYKGTSEYNSNEMAELIDGTISELSMAETDTNPL